MFDFKEKNVLITGGSRGIGLATALAFANAGANVAFTYHSDDVAAASAVKGIQQFGVKALSAKVNFSEETDLSRIIEDVIKNWGSLDIAIGNAGIWKGALVQDMSVEEYRETMDVNMTGTFLLAKFSAQQMIKQRSGSMVFISSTAGQRGESQHSHYAASKGAQISFTKSLAVELAPYNIRVNSVAPGWVNTDMTSAALTDPEESQRIKTVVPLARAGQPHEIANAVLFLASPLASYITGEILNVNGGMVLCG